MGLGIGLGLGHHWVALLGKHASRCVCARTTALSQYIISVTTDKFWDMIRIIFCRFVMRHIEVERIRTNRGNL